MKASKVKIQVGTPVLFCVEELGVSGSGEVADWNVALDSVRVAAKEPQEAIYVLGLEHLVCQRTKSPLCYVAPNQKTILLALSAAAGTLYTLGDYIFEVVRIDLSPAKVLGAFLAVLAAGMASGIFLRFLRDARRKERFWRFGKGGLAIEIGGGEDGYFVLTNTKVKKVERPPLPEVAEQPEA